MSLFFLGRIGLRAKAAVTRIKESNRRRNAYVQAEQYVLQYVVPYYVYDVGTCIVVVYCAEL